MHPWCFLSGCPEGAGEAGGSRRRHTVELLKQGLTKLLGGYRNLHRNASGSEGDSNCTDRGRAESGVLLTAVVGHLADQRLLLPRIRVQPEPCVPNMSVKATEARRRNQGDAARRRLNMSVKIGARDLDQVRARAFCQVCVQCEGNG